MESNAKVLIICRNRLLRESISRILSKKPDLQLIATKALGTTCREEILACGAQVLVLDSLEFLLGNSQSLPKTQPLSRSIWCVLVAMEDDQNRFLAAVQHGVRGYVLQDASAGDVVSAIRAVAEGQVMCPPSYARVLFDFVATQTDELPDSQKRARWGLTRREQQVIPLISRGLTNKEIAKYMNLSEQTVKNHVHRILRKLDVPDRLDISEALRNQTLFSSTNVT
jgi:DNA-binding NarL/FixJ family response regulator